jgi:hypothetical protein
MRIGIPSLAINSNRALPKYGPPLGINMGFGTDTVWARGPGWSIGSGLASFATPGFAGIITQANVFDEIGAEYFLQFFVQSLTAGGFHSYSGANDTIPATSVLGVSAGLKEGVITSYSTTLVVRGSAAGVGSIDYVVVRKVLR